jgi:hypothetical protein
VPGVWVNQPHQVADKVDRPAQVLWMANSWVILVQRACWHHRQVRNGGKFINGLVLNGSRRLLTIEPFNFEVGPPVNLRSVYYPSTQSNKKR